MSINARLPENSSQSSSAVSVFKIIGGVCGFAAVLAIHQLLAPSEVVETAELTLESSSDVTQQTAFTIEEAVVDDEVQVQAIDEQDDEITEQNALTATDIQPVDGATEFLSDSLVVPAQTSAKPAQTDSYSVVDDSDEPSVQSNTDSAEVLPSLNSESVDNDVDHAAIPLTNVVSDDVSLADENPLIDTETSDLQWSAVWRPFFSPTTAQGFAEYISDSTGLKLRVQPSTVAGHYLVEVEHRTEAERIDADRRIVETTGYVPPGVTK